MPIAIPSDITTRGHWQPVTVDKEDVKGVRRLLDTRTGELYVADRVEEVWSKVAVLSFGLPLWTLGQMSWSAGRCLVDIPRIALRAINITAADWKKGDPLGRLAKDFVGRISRDLYQQIGRNVRNFVTAPLFGVGMMAMATTGFLFPCDERNIFEARKTIARIEYEWQDRVSYKEDVRWQGRNANSFYLAWCFQPRGNVEDGRHSIRKWGWDKTK